MVPSEAVTTSDSPNDFKAQEAALVHELASVRAERARVQRRITTRTGLETSVERTHREQSMRTSPEVIEMRATVEELATKLRHLWDDIDTWHSNYNMAARRTAITDPRFENDFAAEATHRASVRDRLADADIRLDVPRPATNASNSSTAASHDDEDPDGTSPTDTPERPS